MGLTYHYIGLDVHKRTDAFCEKRADGKTVASDSFSTRREALKQWVVQRRMPWMGAMETTLFLATCATRSRRMR